LASGSATALRYGFACASGIDRFKVKLQLEKCGLMPCFKVRISSGHELPRSKEAPEAVRSMEWLARSAVRWILGDEHMLTLPQCASE